MVRIGVIGAGHLGKIHLKLLKGIPEFELVGFYDTNREVATKVSEEMGVKAFPIMEQLMDEVDAVDIVTPTVSHFECAATAIRKGKHIFVEKPITTTLEEARQLMMLVEEAGVRGQVGHVERFNPALLSLQGRTLKPMFIEAHRLAQFNPRGTDVSVVLDLMIHDIDIALSLVKSGVKRISASGVAVVSQSPDIANARIEFDNGCVANLTASRISVKQMRKMRLFQRDAYISMDFLKKQSQIITLEPTDDPMDPLSVPVASDSGSGYKRINFEEPNPQEVNAIGMELELFAKSIMQEIDPPVTVLDGYNALQVAYQVLEKIEHNKHFQAL